MRAPVCGGSVAVAVTTAMLVAETAPHADELHRALTTSGFDVRRARPAELADRPELLDEPDVVLVSAALGLQRVALLGQRFAGADKHPAVLVFPEDDPGALEACVRGGFDYVTPPYLPGLLRGRLVSSHERGRLVGAVEAMATMASLHAYERDLSIAREIQAGFLPEHLSVPDGWEFDFRFRPARHVAGDFYDVFEMVNGRRLGFVVADVCDKGVSAALFMALIRTLLRHTADNTSAWNLMDAAPGPLAPGGGSLPPALGLGAGPLVQSVVSTNRYLARNHLRQGYFVTLFFGVLDPVSGSLLYINGGHNPPVLLRGTGERVPLRPTGPAVGMAADSVYSLGHARLEPGDTLFAYTDGVVDARSPKGAPFGTSRLHDLLAPDAPSGRGLLETVDRALAEHVGAAEQFDDITMLALRRAG